ncbi:MAG: hypothetical protein MR512_03490 [Anaerococcus sp.]|nr:hypothetical protein [Anaerococcus sp.]
MKIKRTITALLLALTLSGCVNQAGEEQQISDQTIEKALESSESIKVAKEEEAKEDQKKTETKENTDTEENKEVKETKEKNEEKVKDLDHAKLRDAIVKIGEFDEAILDKLSDVDLEKYYLDAKKASEETGYWDIKDFIFQELSKDYKDLSKKFPLDSVEVKYSWPKSEDKVTDKFVNERTFLINLGYSQNQVNEISDKKLEEAFKKAYEENKEAYYTDYVKIVGANLLGEVPKPEPATQEEGEILKFAQSDKDYEDFKQSLVELYEFDPDVVSQIPNSDIDLAYTRAQKKLEETGFGDIGLIINEVGIMYPGSSTMYPGK